MSRIPPISKNQADHDLRLAFFQHVADQGSPISNMQATLAHSRVAFDVYMQWYPLYQSVQGILGERLAYLFAYSVAEASNSVVSSMIFRKQIIDGGEEPEHLQLSAEEKLVMEFGATIARTQGHIPDKLYKWVSIFFTDKEMVVLSAFAGQMIAACIFNNVVQTELDDFLIPYLPFTVAF